MRYSIITLCWWTKNILPPNNTTDYCSNALSNSPFCAKSTAEHILLYTIEDISTDFLLKQLELIDPTHNIQNMIRDYTKKLAQIKNALYL